MLSNLQDRPADKILALSEAFCGDTRQGKIDLGVGIYRDPNGVTPVMRAVKEAERQIWETQTSKAYTSLVGEASYREAMVRLVLGDDAPTDRIGSVSTVGGTGAIRMAFELARAATPDLTVHLSNPTWPNHLTIVDAMGLPRETYRYFDAVTGEVDIDGMIADLNKAKPGDVVVLHGCCHNPTGANPTAAQWDLIIDAVARTGALPLVDLAYQGFGDGLEADAEATRKIAAAIPEVMIASSCSKNFGIYRERTGALLVIAKTPFVAKTAQVNLAAFNRAMFSFPPDHGARIVTTILESDALRKDWVDELEAVRLNMLSLRQQLSDELRQITGTGRFDFIARHRGMFSLLGITPAQVDALREDFAVYMVGDSRLNIAGLNSATVPVLARAVGDLISKD